MHVNCTFIRKNDSSTLVDVLYSFPGYYFIILLFKLCIPIALKNWVERGGGGTQTNKNCIYNRRTES